MRIRVLYILIALSFNLSGGAAERYVLTKDEAFVFRRSALVSLNGDELKKLGDQLYGGYLCPFELLNGCTLHLYPGGVAHLVEFSDISVDVPLASGSWRIVGAFVEVEWQFTPDQQLNVRSRVERRYGDVGQFLVLRDDVQTESPNLYVIARNRNVDGPRFFMQRQVRYVDWPRYKKAMDENFETAAKKPISP